MIHRSWWLTQHLEEALLNRLPYANKPNGLTQSLFTANSIPFSCSPITSRRIAISTHLAYPMLINLLKRWDKPEAIAGGTSALSCLSLFIGLKLGWFLKSAYFLTSDFNFIEISPRKRWRRSKLYCELLSGFSLKMSNSAPRCTLDEHLTA